MNKCLICGGDVQSPRQADEGAVHLRCVGNFVTELGAARQEAEKWLARIHYLGVKFDHGLDRHEAEADRSVTAFVNRVGKVLGSHRFGYEPLAWLGNIAWYVRVENNVAWAVAFNHESGKFQRKERADWVVPIIGAAEVRIMNRELEAMICGG